MVMWIILYSGDTSVGIYSATTPDFDGDDGRELLRESLKVAYGNILGGEVAAYTDAEYINALKDGL